MKIIKRIWLPTKLPELAIWFMNFNLRFSDLATDLGFTAADVTKIEGFNTTVQWLADGQETSDANADSFRKFRENTLFGEKGDPVPVEPSTTLPTPPAAFAKEIIEQLVRIVDLIYLSDKYSTDIGAQLGILPAKSDPVSPEDWTTTLKVKVLPEMELEIDFVKGDSNGINLQYQYVGEETWNNAGNYNKRPAVIKITGKTPNAPQAVRIRGRLLKGNSPAGQFSDTVNAVAAP